MTVSDQPALSRVPITPDQVEYLIATAARAPSIHNTQPWRFRASQYSIELYADPGRKLRADPLGRELLISCGGALFGLRLGMRSLGYVPVVELLPDPARLCLLARLSLADPAPMNAAERAMLRALPHRHTHRGPFTPDPLPAGLLAGLHHDALTEGATLAFLDRAHAYEQLADIAAAVKRRQDADLVARADVKDWTRGPASRARDGVPASAFTARGDQHRGRLAQRDFDLGRGLGLLDTSGPPPAATAVLLTPGDGHGDWLCAGQALHRVLAHAASRWVFATIHTQPLQTAAVREQIADRLVLPGSPQMILQLGIARSTSSTARRPPAELLEP
jgi:hypothetical protein